MHLNLHFVLYVLYFLDNYLSLINISYANSSKEPIYKGTTSIQNTIAENKLYLYDSRLYMSEFAVHRHHILSLLKELK